MGLQVAQSVGSMVLTPTLIDQERAVYRENDERFGKKPRATDRMVMLMLRWTRQHE